MIAKLLTGNIKSDKKTVRASDWCLYGMTPEEFKRSTMNPATIAKQNHTEECIEEN